ncbi:MAG: uracil-DNA glycosylase [Gemmatimonadota bacterium]|nr:uracil-DNA glycosylase [Gemmatimonadota bacterium]MDQ8152392.1 uracil-DNA glycosylase [Gemmatimonadota bacterium]MDQ8174192.1 uracil-DNA glycosylase [Gemmatimonadota bacterium]MDQ8178772.1 uracil-DNA glycosylase [Gemmatimonadota bacterium]
MSDAHERLRQYLAQRKEMGEQEFVLDSLSVDEALKVLAFGATPPVGAAPSAARSADVPPPVRDSEKRRAAEALAGDGDWRKALASIDAGAPAKPLAPARSPEPAPAAPARVVAAASSEANSADAPERVALDVGGGSTRSGREDLDTLQAVAAAIAACSACSLASTAINHVPGEGNPNAGFVIVGEAPGATEDELGRPFVGKSGDLLTKILEAIQFRREDVFICNVLKHRPPGNRNPSPSEIVACRPFLLRQLELLRPRVILALGTFAAQTLLESDSPIGKLRGIEHRYHGIPLVATYHPAALLRNPNWKRPAWEDVQLARRIFDRA